MRQATLILASVTVLAIALSGCAPTVDLEPWAFGEPPAAQTADEASESETVDVSTLAAGDTISEELARELNRDVRSGLRGYELPDGTFVVVKPDEPLPAAVKADAEAKANSLPVPTGTSPEDQIATGSGARGVSAQLSMGTGKRVVVVVYGSISLPDWTVAPGWIAIGSPENTEGLFPVGTSLESVLAETQALIAAQSNSAEWEIIVQTKSQ